MAKCNLTLDYLQAAAVHYAERYKQQEKPSLTRPPRPKSPPDPIGADEAAPELGGADAAALELVVLHSSGTICQSRCCPCMSHMYAVTQKSSDLAYSGKTNLAVDP